MKFLPHLANTIYGWRRKIATGSVGVLALLLGYHVVFGANGWMTYHDKKVEYRKLQQEVLDIQKENDRLAQQIKSLKSDPKAIEKEAREQLRYAKPGEVIYVMPAQPAQQQPNTGLAQK